MKPTTVYFPYFDYLRIVLAIIVMLGHDNVIRWSLSGNLSVQVFFALSGWLIGGILLDTPYTQLPRFYFNRAIRIWVPYYLALIFLIAASLLREPITAKWLEFSFYKLSFVYNLFGTPQLAQYGYEMPLRGTGNHFWSINAEEQFYLIAPLLLVLISPKIGRSVSLWIVIALAALTTNIYASIVFGVLAAVVVKRYGSIHLRPSVRYTLFAITLAAFAGIVAGGTYYILAPIFSIGVVLLLAIQGTQNSLGTFLGGMSYPLYLNHWMGVFLGNLLLRPFHLQDSVARHILSVILGLGIAAGLYWWVDRRLRIWRGKVFAPRLGVMTTVAAYSLTIVGLLGGLYPYLKTHGIPALLTP